MSVTQVHIEHIDDIPANLRAGMDAYQTAIDTTNNRQVWSNETPDYIYYNASGWKIATADGAVTYLDEWFNDVNVEGSMYLTDYIYGNDDTDTYIHRTDDAWDIQAGSVDLVSMVQDTQSYISMNPDGADVDLRLYDSASAVLLWGDAADARVGIGTSTPDTKLEVAIEDAATDTVTDVIKATHTTTDTPTTGFGVGFLAEIESNCGVQLAGRLSWAMTDATGAADTTVNLSTCVANSLVNVFSASKELVTIKCPTSNSADTGYTDIAGGGGALAERGAFARLFGNEHASQPGSLWLKCGTGGSLMSSLGDNAGVCTWTVCDSGDTPMLTVDSNGLATFAGAVDVAGTLTVQASLTFDDDGSIIRDTADASDNGQIAICGGGAVNGSRGGYLFVCGNEHASYPGLIGLICGTGGYGIMFGGSDKNSVAYNAAAAGKFRKLYVNEDGYVVVGDADVNNND